jgi:UDP-N-acetylglucosamine 4-epimerase
MKVLVTGGAGFIGSNIVNELEKDNDIDKIIVVDNLINGRPQNIKKSSKINFRKGDICDFDLMNDLCERVDVICHQAAWGSVPRSIEYPKDYMKNNVQGFTSVVEAARNNNIKKIIYASSSSVYGDNQSIYKVEDNIGNQLSPYALSKRFDEMLAQNFHNLYEIEFFGLRYFNVFGENQRWDSEYSAVIPKFINKLLNNESPTIFGDGNQSRDFTYIKNVVDFNINLIKKDINGNHVLNVGLGKSTSVNQIYDIISSKLNSNRKAIYKEKRKGDILNSLADISKSIELGYDPKVEIEEGLDRTINWFLKNFNRTD